MTDLARHRLGIQHGVQFPEPDDPIIDPQIIGADQRHLITRFGAAVWPLAIADANPSAPHTRIHWNTFPAPLREQFRLAAWVLLNRPVPENALLARAMRSRLSTRRIQGTVCHHWRTFAHWLDGRGVNSLHEVTPQNLTDYSIYLARTRKVARNTALSHLLALSRLAAYAPELPDQMRIKAPPWDAEGTDDYLPAVSAGGENVTEPIDPATIGPLLVWALKFVEDFSIDILAARREEQRLRERAARANAQPAGKSRSLAIRPYLEHLEAAGLPVPMQTYTGKVAATYIAALTGIPHTKVVSAFDRSKYRWHAYAYANPGPCPLDIPITGTIDGRPWVEAINFDEVEIFTKHLVTACYIVLAYLTGMRPHEALALEAGCCPEPHEAEPSGPRRARIYARHFKTARDQDGNHLSAGALRQAPWIAVPPVVSAIRVLEAISGTGLLFPTDSPKRQGRALAVDTMSARIDRFAEWVNQLSVTANTDDTIPADPLGPIGIARFRRTLAWHIARQPGGLVALAVQYGHMRTIVSEGYSSRARGGIHELLDVETARAVAEHLSQVHGALQHGEGVSGPAAHRLIHAAHEQHQRFGGIVTTPRQAKTLLGDPTLTVFENPDAYLICNYEPTRALCNPATGGSGQTPSLDRCRAGCPNIARTDFQASQLRQQAQQLRQQADTPFTPEPVAERLRHRADHLTELADHHVSNRIVTAVKDQP